MFEYLWENGVILIFPCNLNIMRENLTLLKGPEQVEEVYFHDSLLGGGRLS